MICTFNLSLGGMSIGNAPRAYSPNIPRESRVHQKSLLGTSFRRAVQRKTQGRRDRHLASFRESPLTGHGFVPQSQHISTNRMAIPRQCGFAGAFVIQLRSDLSGGRWAAFWRSCECEGHRLCVCLVERNAETGLALHFSVRPCVAQSPSPEFTTGFAR